MLEFIYVNNKHINTTKIINKKQKQNIENIFLRLFNWWQHCKRFLTVQLLSINCWQHHAIGIHLPSSQLSLSLHGLSVPVTKFKTITNYLHINFTKKLTNKKRLTTHFKRLIPSIWAIAFTITHKPWWYTTSQCT